MSYVPFVSTLGLIPARNLENKKIRSNSGLSWKAFWISKLELIFICIPCKGYRFLSLRSSGFVFHGMITIFCFFSYRGMRLFGSKVPLGLSVITEG